MSDEQKPNRIESVANLIAAVVRLAWVLVAIALLSGAGWLLFGHGRGNPAPAKDVLRTKPVLPPVDWTQVDAEIAKALQGAHAAAEGFAAKALDAWGKGVMKRVDEEFLDWFFGYFNQQVLGVKGLWNQVAHWVDQGRPTAAEQLTAEFQEQLARRVLRPEIAQAEMERIAQQAVEVYVSSLRASLAVIPEKYKIPRPDWERHLSDLALIVHGAEGNREVALTMKAFTATSLTAAVVLAKFSKDALTKIASRITGKLAAQAGGKVAAKTGGEVAAKTGGRFLGPIIAAGIVLWDIYDHYHTKKVEKPILRKNIADYLDQMKQMLLTDPETGILATICEIERNALESMKQVAGAKAAPKEDKAG